MEADFFYTRSVGIKPLFITFFYEYKKKLHMVRTKKVSEFFFFLDDFKSLKVSI